MRPARPLSGALEVVIVVPHFGQVLVPRPEDNLVGYV